MSPIPERGRKGAGNLKIRWVVSVVRAPVSPPTPVPVLLLVLPLVLTLVSNAAPGALADDSRFTNPEAHFGVEQPAALTAADAQAVYDRILDEIVRGYRLSGDPLAVAYRGWRRFNSAPYRSATHGERFVNNYGNAKGLVYGRFEAAGEMPVGAVLAKDSFAVTAEGDIFIGPLFLMEKMEPGFNPASRDWRYSMIMPDGSLFGVTEGQGADRVAFCIACHETAGDENDHLFFVPRDYRQARTEPEEE